MWALVIVVIIIWCVLMEASRRPRFYPPGPPSLPIIGNYPAIWWKRRKLKYNHNIWSEWAQEYGDLIGLRFGSKNVVVVSGKDMIKEVSSREVFEGRPTGFFYTFRGLGKRRGIVFTEGSTWSSGRRLMLKFWKNFGYGTNAMETIIAAECKALVELRMTDAGQLTLVNEMFDITIMNILWRLMAGKRYDLNDDRLKNICHCIRRSFNVVDMSGGFINYLPFLRHIFPGLTGYKDLVEVYGSLLSFVREVTRDHMKNFEMNNPRDVIDMFLIERSRDKNSIVGTDEDLDIVCLDVLQAGLETVGNTVAFMFLYMVRHENIQNKVIAEIDEVIGKRTPTLEDRRRMTYTEAVIMETLRMSAVAPIGIPHRALDDAKLGNYIIPKDTLIVLSAYDLLHNMEHWKDPEQFQPERFLTKDGNLMQDEWLMPFGIGKRRCLGEGLARSEMFLFLTFFLQKFKLEFPEGEPLPTIEYMECASLSPKPYRIIFKPRA